MTLTLKLQSSTRIDSINPHKHEIINVSNTYRTIGVLMPCCDDDADDEYSHVLLWQMQSYYCQLAIFRFDFSLCKHVLNNASEEGMIIMFQVGIILPEAFTFKLYVQINPKF